VITLIIARLAAFAAPLLAKAVVVLGTTVLVVGTFASVQTWRIGQIKDDIALIEAQAKLSAASARALVDVLNAERAAADTQIQDSIAAALADRPAQVRTVTRTVERIARADPDFALARRPAELAALRLQQLADVDKANGHRVP